MTKVSYGAATEDVIDLFDAYFTGSSRLPFLVVSGQALENPVKNALEKSLASLGYTTPAYSVIVISPDEQPILDPGALRLLIEAIDPLRIICTDDVAMKALDSAYKMQLIPNAINRIMGRSSGVFSDLNDMVQDDKSKYIAWEIFKALK